MNLTDDLGWLKFRYITLPILLISGFCFVFILEAIVPPPYFYPVLIIIGVIMVGTCIYLIHFYSKKPPLLKEIMDVPQQDTFEDVEDTYFVEKDDNE